MTVKDALEAGAKAPAFSAQDQDGKRHQLKDYKGKTLVLYFYPKDDTPGCTREACDFKTKLKSFKSKKAVVLGVSPDPVLSHKKFAKKFSLNFPLLSDEDKTICEAYGVWKLKTFMGRKYMGVERSTFVIGPDGKLLRVDRSVKVDGHIESLLESL